MCFTVLSSHCFNLERDEEQGDQIGRICAQWVAVYFEQFLLNAEVAHTLGYLFKRSKVMR
jgi:hypothetical protein